MKQLFLVPLAFVALAVPVAVMAGSGEGGFDGVVHSIESRYNVHATRIPFLGLISLVANRASHGGVSSMHVAEIDNFYQAVDGDELNTMIEEKLGSGWERMVRETSRQGRDQTLIFTRPEGSRMGLFVVDLDGNEIDVVQLSVDPSHLSETIGQHTRHHNNGDADNDGDKNTGPAD